MRDARVLMLLLSGQRPSSFYREKLQSGSSVELKQVKQLLRQCRHFKIDASSGPCEAE